MIEINKIIEEYRRVSGGLDKDCDFIRKHLKKVYNQGKKDEAAKNIKVQLDHLAKEERSKQRFHS